VSEPDLASVEAARLQAYAAYSADRLAKTAGIRIEPVTRDQARAARSAHLQFGKGSGRGAALSYRDCFAYGLAKAMDAPLLCKGNDFPLTDINIA
jgi:ribonuclease VapC